MRQCAQRGREKDQKHMKGAQRAQRSTIVCLASGILCMEMVVSSARSWETRRKKRVSIKTTTSLLRFTRPPSRGQVGGQKSCPAANGEPHHVLREQFSCMGQTRRRENYGYQDYCSIEAPGAFSSVFSTHQTPRSCGNTGVLATAFPAKHAVFRQGPFLRDGVSSSYKAATATASASAQPLC